MRLAVRTAQDFLRAVGLPEVDFRFLRSGRGDENGNNRRFLHRSIHQNGEKPQKQARSPFRFGEKKFLAVHKNKKNRHIYRLLPTNVEKVIK
jgi:hypothetical protein